MKHALMFLAGLVAAALLYAAGTEVFTAKAQAEAGATAYGWLASPAADGAPANRAKILETLIEREVAAQKARP